MIKSVKKCECTKREKLLRFTQAPVSPKKVHNKNASNK